jgi:predicted hydrolase (HD superfamily)
MSTITPARETAFELFKKYNKSESLLKHALSAAFVLVAANRRRYRNSKFQKKK